MKCLWTLASGLLLLFTGLAPAWPQSGAPGGKTSDSELAQDLAKSKGDFSQEPIVYEFVHTAMRYETDGSGTRETRARARVQTSAGLEKVGQLIFPYNAENESVEIRSVSVTKPEETVVKTRPENVQDLSALVTREAPVYTDAREKHVIVAALSVGDILEFDVVENSRPLLAGQFWNTWELHDAVICVEETLELNVPRDRQLKFNGLAGVVPTSRDEGDRRVYQWKTSNLHVANPFEGLRAKKIDLKSLLEGISPPRMRHIEFSTFQSWSDVGKWYEELEREKRVPDTKVHATADEIVRGKITDLEKAEALYQWVSSNIRYVSLSFGVGRYQPHAASEVLSNRYGDCKDKATLLDAFFEAEGIHGQTVLINSKGDFGPDVPSPLQFDHAITFVAIEGKDEWLDSTIGVLPFGYLLPRMRGEEALIVYPTVEPALRKTPAELPMPTLYKIEVAGDLSSDGTLDANVKLETRGDLEVVIRLLAAHLSPSQVSSLFEDFARTANSSTYGPVKFTNLKLQNGSDTTNPLSAELHFKGKLMYLDPEKSSASEFMHALSAALIANHGLLPVPRKEQEGAENPGGSSLPIELGGPTEYALTVSLTVPTAKPDSEQKPLTVHVSEDFATYDASAGWQGQTFQGSWRLSLLKERIPVDGAQEYAEFQKKVMGSAQPSSAGGGQAAGKISDRAIAGIVSENSSTKSRTSTAPPTANEAAASKPDSAQPPHPIAGAAEAMFKQGQDEAKRNNWANAIEKYQSAVKLNPQYADAWRELGREQMLERNYPDAENSFRQYLVLAPDDSRAYLNMAWALYTEKKFAEDIELLEKRIVKAPRDGDAHTRLGAAYLAMHQPERAIPELERGASLFPKYEYARFTLARAYLEAHEDSKAASAFEEAVAIDGSDSVLNSAAYQLADHGAFLDLAEPWAVRAVSSVETELNQTTLRTPASRTTPFVSRLGAYWDTLGWIKFQKGDLASAEKYISAAWMLRDDTTVSAHLGRVFEAQKRKSDAIEAYAEALFLVPTTREANDDEKDARKRLAGLLGGEAEIEGRIKEARTRMRARASISIANPDGVQGIAQYLLLIGPDAKLVDIDAMMPDDPLSPLTEALRSSKMPLTFADSTLQKLPRIGTLACAGGGKTCTLTLMTEGAGSRVLPSSTPVDSSE